MILQPSILALFFASFLISLMILLAAVYGVQILRRWDIASGSELQLVLERRTYLISTIVSYFLVFQLVSLFLFIQTADSISNLFVGAMCAVGTLSVNSFGYPALILKIATFLLAGVWMIINYADNQGYDYPLIRTKYRLLLVMMPFILAETVFQGLFFFGLKPDIITSCCGSLFSPSERGILNEIVNAPPMPMLAMFYIFSAATVASGVWFYLRGKAIRLFSLLSIVQFFVSLASLVSVISLYIYSMPSHHCPFCILQKEYGFIGYPIYLSIFLSVICGIGAGLLDRYGNKESLRNRIPSIQRKLVLTGLVSVLLLVVISTGYVLLTSFTMR